MDLPDAQAKELIAQGAALWEIRDTAGFKLLDRTLRSLASQAALTGMQDEERPIDYWRGYVAACNDFVANVDRIIERANELKEEHEADGREAIGIRIGRGGGSIAAEGID